MAFRTGVLILTFVLSIFKGQAFAANSSSSATALAKQTVIKAIHIIKQTDLNFGEAAQGDPSVTIDPNASGNDKRASFSVSGEPNHEYDIFLPEGSIKMTTLGGGPSQNEINVKNFQSFPSKKGRLSILGIQSIYVGATRDPLLRDQTPGQYQGEFKITVAY